MQIIYPTYRNFRNALNKIFISFCAISLIFTALSDLVESKIPQQKYKKLYAKSHRNTYGNKVLFIKYMISKKRYQKAISMIEKELIKYPEYGNQTQQLHMLKIIAQYKQSNEYENSLDQAKILSTNIAEYTDNFDLNDREEKQINEIDNNSNLKCARHFLKNSIHYLTQGNYISSIKHALNSIQTATKSYQNDQKKQIIIEARKILMISLQKIGLSSEAARIKPSAFWS